ncbi:MAG TPA: Ig-like domain-containing protein [Aggregatilinea sp.]|uniref:Ig-like domain-containing protein n=1 Tax=Aggregatilinea sp. TaxID=2806333 RepID=UPI002CEDE597|nr:Ig-like domain-containing protein [Aggregatilinea sp.]HML21020.1 Ig-like domain-containing protein [Aggregatilinea sp.]
MSADLHRVVRRLDVLFLIGLVVTSGLAALLFWVEFYDKDETTTQLPSVMEVGGVPATEPPVVLEVTPQATEELVPATPLPTELVTESPDLSQTEAVVGEPQALSTEVQGTPIAEVPTVTELPRGGATEEAEALPLGETIETAEAMDGQGGMTVQGGQTPTGAAGGPASPTQEVFPSPTLWPTVTATNTSFPNATVPPATATQRMPVSTATNTLFPRATVPPATATQPATLTMAAPTPAAMSGTAAPGDVVELYEDGSLVASATADAQGVWSVALPEGVDPGSVVVVTIVPGDLSGQGGPLGTVEGDPSGVSPTLTFTPWPGINPPASVTPFALAVVPTATGGASAATPTQGATVVAMAPELNQAAGPEAAVSEPDAVIISGTAEPGASVIITADGEEIGQATADDSGAWSFTWVPGAAAGPDEPEPEIEVLPAEGGEALLPQAVAVVSAPTISVPVSGDIVLPGPLVAMGYGAPGATIRLENQTAGAVLGSTTVQPSGQWQIRAAMAGEGEQALVAVMITTEGQIIPSAPVTVILAQPVHPQTGMDFSRDGAAGRAFAALVALLLAAGGFATYFAGRLVYMLAQDRRQAG